jgi:hypothetical protein
MEFSKVQRSVLGHGGRIVLVSACFSPMTVSATAESLETLIYLASIPYAGGHDAIHDLTRATNHAQGLIIRQVMFPGL